MDPCTRRITGWSVSEHCDTALALSALADAVAKHWPSAGLVHHTDRGSTYTAGNYRWALDDCEMVASMSGKGNCSNNVVRGESTIGNVKTEALADYIPADIHDLRRILFGYIGGLDPGRSLDIAPWRADGRGALLGASGRR